MERYWLTFRHRLLMVTFHLEHDFEVGWKGVYGLSWRGWFVGVVRSQIAPVLPSMSPLPAPKEGETT